MLEKTPAQFARKQGAVKSDGKRESSIIQPARGFAPLCIQGLSSPAAPPLCGAATPYRIRQTTCPFLPAWKPRGRIRDTLHPSRRASEAPEDRDNPLRCILNARVPFHPKFREDRAFPVIPCIAESGQSSFLYCCRKNSEAGSSCRIPSNQPQE